jgi:hypothetical protein
MAPKATAKASKSGVSVLSRVREFRGFFACFGGWAGSLFCVVFP